MAGSPRYRAGRSRVSWNAITRDHANQRDELKSLLS